MKAKEYLEDQEWNANGIRVVDTHDAKNAIDIQIAEDRNIAVNIFSMYANVYGLPSYEIESFKHYLEHSDKPMLIKHPF